MSNYTIYHLHSSLSNGVTNIDSITEFHDYVDAAKESGMTAMAFSEHGNIFAWLKKKEAIEAAGMKYIHAIEAYLTEDISETVVSQSADVILLDGKVHKNMPIYKSYEREDGALIGECSRDGNAALTGFILPETLVTKSEPQKQKDNYHCVLIARNYDGVKEINKLTSKSFNRSDGHYYYVPRITFDELFSTSDNVIITTACLGGVLNKGVPSAKEKFLNFLRKNSGRCFLEIQHHNCEDQIAYNQTLLNLSRELGIRLIAGTDTHALNEEHMDGRAMLQKAKGVRFANEDEWDLTFKTYDQLLTAYKKQNSLPMDVVKEAIENTNYMASMIEPFTIDYSPKYPKLYADSEKVFKEKINEGVIRRGINKKPNYKEYIDRIHYEYDTYKHNGAIDFMLLEEDYKSAMRAKGIKYGYSRGSVSGSVIAYLLGITEVDSVKYNLNFERFMNRERVSLADVDSDWLSEDRKEVKDYLHNKPGLYCCDIVTFNTIAMKGAVNDVVRAFHRENLDSIPEETRKRIEKFLKEHSGEKLPPLFEKEYEVHAKHKEVPYDYNEFSDKLNDMIETDEAAARKKYAKLFKYIDLVNGCIVSVGNHPAGCVVSPYPVDEWFGTFTTSNDEYAVSQLNMKEIDALNFVKLDILGLDNMGLIYKTCDLAGIQFLTPDNTPADDMDVWNSIKEDTTLIFQWESESATAYLKQLFSDETIRRIREKNPDFSYMDLLSIGNGAIRPAGESYRDALAQGVYKDNGNEALNNFMRPTLGYCIEENQIVRTKNGGVPIKDINIGDTVYTENGESEVIAKTYTGYKPVIKLTTSVSSLKCTPDHRILTDSGWKKAGDIHIGDVIAYRVGNSSDTSYDKYKLRLIGYLLGDGILTGGNNVGFVNANINVVNDFCKCVSAFDDCATSVKNRKSRVNKTDLFYANVKHREPKKTMTEVAKYLCQVGLKWKGGGLNAKGKFVPDFIFSLDSKSIIEFLGAYTDTDCCLSNHDTLIAVYKTSSPMLANGIAELIRLVGFTAAIKTDTTTGGIAIIVNNAREYIKTIYHASINAQEKYSINDFESRRSFSGDNMISDRVFSEVIENLPISKHELSHLYRVNMYKTAKYRNLATLRKLMVDYNICCDYLQNKNIKWVKVEGVDDSGDANVYDLTIKNEHNFVCNGIVVHNCVYQEQIIEFLHKFCGFTMGEADVVRRHFSKKTGTEKDIPIIKDGGILNEKTGHYIKGFIQTMIDDYGETRESAEKIIASFLQVIQDASDYLFSKNHADPYSWIGYICGYLRYHYPLECLTTALNIFEGKEEKSKAIINYAKKQNIPIRPIKFRHSISKYSCDKETHEIFKGLSSIKYMNENASNEIYALKDNNYNSFIDVLYDLSEKTSANARQIRILIELDFFSEFGDANYLLKCKEVFDAYCDKKQIKKQKLAEDNISEELVRPYAEKETEKMFSNINMREFIVAYCKTLQVPKRTMRQRIESQIENLGYVDIVGEEYTGMAVVVDLDTKYSPRVKLYSLKNGTTIDCKIDKKTFNKNKLKVGDTIRIIKSPLKHKNRKNENGDWEPIPDQLERWITEYKKVEL